MKSKTQKKIVLNVDVSVKTPKSTKKKTTKMPKKTVTPKVTVNKKKIALGLGALGTALGLSYLAYKNKDKFFTKAQPTVQQKSSPMVQQTTTPTVQPEMATPTPTVQQTTTPTIEEQKPQPRAQSKIYDDDPLLKEIQQVRKNLKKQEERVGEILLTKEEIYAFLDDCVFTQNRTDDSCLLELNKKYKYPKIGAFLRDYNAEMKEIYKCKTSYYKRNIQANIKEKLMHRCEIDSRIKKI